MVEDTLVDRKIEKGAKLLEALDAAGLPVDAALWFYFPESEQVATCHRDPDRRGRAGPLAAYGAFREASRDARPGLRVRAR